MSVRKVGRAPKNEEHSFEQVVWSFSYERRTAYRESGLRTYIIKLHKVSQESLQLGPRRRKTLAICVILETVLDAPKGINELELRLAVAAKVRGMTRDEIGSALCDARFVIDYYEKWQLKNMPLGA